MRRALSFFTESEGSTRLLGLLRIAIGLLVINTWSAKFILWRLLPGGEGSTRWTWSTSVLGVVLGVILLASATTLTLGRFSRLSALICGTCQLFGVVVVGAYLGRRGFFHHYTQIVAVSTFLLAVGPCGRSLSWDRWRAIKRGDARQERGNLLAQRLLALFLSTIYFWTAIDKLRFSFLSGNEIERIFMHYYGDSHLPTWGAFSALMLVIAWGTVVFEFAAAFLLWWPRAWRYVFACGLVFHVGIFITMEVYTFSFTTMTLYFAFLDADRVHAFIDRVLDHR